MEEERDKKEYEISFLVREEADAEAVRSLMTRHGGEVLSSGPLRRIALAYKIDREMHAYFGFFRARFSPEAVTTFKVDLQTSEKTLRFLVLIPAKSQGERIQPREPIEAPQKPRSTMMSQLPLSNEALEKKIEEILQ